MSTIPPPVFIKFERGDESSPLRCPRCKGDYVYWLSDRVHMSGPEDSPTGGPYRGQYIAIPCHCESCDDATETPDGWEYAPGFEVFFQFHKGQTFVWAEMVDPPISGGPSA